MLFGEPGEHFYLKLPHGSAQRFRLGRCGRVGAFVLGDVALAPAGVEVGGAATLPFAEKDRQKLDREPVMPGCAGDPVPAGAHDRGRQGDRGAVGGCETTVRRQPGGGRVGKLSLGEGQQVSGLRR